MNNEKSVSDSCEVLDEAPLCSEDGGVNGEGSVISEAAFYLLVIIVIDNLYVGRQGLVGALSPLAVLLTRRHHIAAFEACCLI